MSKMSIEEHKESLKIRELCSLRLWNEYIEAENRYKKYEAEVERYRKQIKRAEKLGKDGFDRERFKDE